MEVSYSAWCSVADESRVVGGESFSFLFDRRYTNRLNRMSRVFFEAYVKAATELAVEEDRFPSLSEIESRMESGAIYAYKDRLMRTTDFFDEVKISGISYLMPQAKRFIDETDTYSDLILDFDQGAVTLPKRKKVYRAEGSEDAEEPGSEETVKEPEAPEEAEDDPFAPLEAGWYEAEIFKSEIKTTNDKTGKYINLGFRILEGDATGRMVFTNLNIVNKSELAVKIARSDLKAICGACDIEDLEDTEDLHNIPMGIKLSVKPETAQWPAKNEIKKFKPLSDMDADSPL